MPARVVALILSFCVLSSSTAQEIVAPATRDVTPPGVMPAPTGDGPLIREPAPPRVPDAPSWRRYFLPVTTNAATFAVRGDLVIRIAGVTPPAVDDTCAFADGTPWPCGRTALHALRMFLHGRAVECFFPYTDTVRDVTAPCRVGQTDLGLWLLRSGWARASDLATTDYLTAVAQARCARVGIWQGEERPDYCPAAAEPEPPPAE